MYAVIQSGGKQYRVAAGDTIFVEKLAGDAGDDIAFDDVLFVSKDGNANIGEPKVDGAVVNGSIVSQGRGKKLTIFKFARRKDYRRRNGHRQAYTAVKISDIVAP